MSIDFGYPVSERIERLINRRLDGEITPEEELELQVALEKDDMARAMLEQSHRIDLVASRALHGEIAFSSKTPAVRPSRMRTLRLVATSAVLAAAAVVAFALLPTIWSNSSPRQGLLSSSGPVAATADSPATNGHFVDYRDDIDFLPHARRRDLLRDVVGIKAKDEKNRDVIYIFERDQESRRIIPVFGDF